MYILIVSHGIPSKEDPQWGCFELDQARALVALGHKVTIAAVDGRFRLRLRRIGYKHNDFDGIDSCSIYLLPLALLRWARLRIWARDRMMFSLFRHMKRRHGLPDVIYAHFFFAISQLESVKRYYPNIPIVGVEHAARITEKSVFTKEEIIQLSRAKNNADKMLSVSPALQESLTKKFNIHSDVLYDMVGEEFLVETLARKRQAPFKFVTTGSLVRRKAIDLVVKAMAEVNDSSSELYIIGEGPERSSIENLISSLNLANRVHLIGMCNKRQIIDLYRECDAFVLVSRAETFCVVNIEAMAMGLPVISTRCGGPEYYLTDANGVLLDVDDYEGLVKAMNYVQCNIGKYKPEEQREFVRSHFSGEVIARQAERIMKEAIENKQN